MGAGVEIGRCKREKTRLDANFALVPPILFVNGLESARH